MQSRAGGPSGLAVRMAEALRWDLDFTRDLRRGDRFKAVYEAMQLDGKDHAVGKLLALVYDNQGRTYEAYRFGASGPHLDYRVNYRGNWIDPLTLGGVRDQPIPRAQLAAFASWRNAVHSSMDRRVVPAVLAMPGSRCETLLAGVAAATGDRGDAGSIMIRRSAPLRGRSAAAAMAR